MLYGGTSLPDPLKRLDTAIGGITLKLMGNPGPSDDLKASIMNLVRSGRRAVSEIRKGDPSFTAIGWLNKKLGTSYSSTSDLFAENYDGFRVPDIDSDSGSLQGLGDMPFGLPTWAVVVGAAVAIYLIMKKVK